MQGKWSIAGMLAAMLMLSLPKAYGQEQAVVEKREGASIVVTGENVCLGCLLKKEQGAAAQCSVYGHTHALRVERATVDGKAAPELKGKVLHYLPNANSEQYIKENHGERLALTGKVYADAQVIEVNARLCGKCGQVKGTEACCKADTPKCGGCQLDKGAPGCCKL